MHLVENTLSALVLKKKSGPSNLDVVVGFPQNHPVDKNHRVYDLFLIKIRNDINFLS